MDDDIDKWLVHLIHDGDDRAFGLLYERYFRRLLAFFLKRGFSRDECRDLIQDTFLRVYRGVGGFQGDALFSSWLLRVANNVATNEIRSRRTLKRDAPEVSLESMEEGAPGALDRRRVDLEMDPQPLEHLIVEEQRQELRQAMASLTLKQQQCLRLQVEQGKSIREISILLDIAAGTVKATLFQARRKLEKILQDSPPAE